MNENPKLATVTLCPRKSDVFSTVADALVAAITQCLDERGHCTLVLSGGSTPRGLHSLLCTEQYRNEIDWSKVHILWGDERTVPADHDDSNFRMAKESLLDPLGIPIANVHRVPTEMIDGNAVASEYQRTIAAITNTETTAPPPTLDIILLGMGDDGHTASLFPGTTAIRESSAWVVANDVPQLNTQRITMTAPLINAARHVWFMVAGDNKAKRLAEVLLGPREIDRLPSQMICPIHGELRWFVDASAASELHRQ